MRLAFIVWLSLGLIFGLATLGILCGGGWWAFSSHNKAEELAKNLVRDNQELERSKKGFIADHEKFTALDKHVREQEADQANSERDRLIALIVAGSSLVPGLLALAFLMMAMLKFLQKPKKKATENEEVEAEEKPAPEPAKKKPVAKVKKTAEED